MCFMLIIKTYIERKQRVFGPIAKVSQLTGSEKYVLRMYFDLWMKQI